MPAGSSLSRVCASRIDMTTHRVRFLVLAAAALLQLTGSTIASEGERVRDAQIDEQVRDAIFKRAEFAGDEISVQTHDGVVYLHGLVDTNVERAAVEALVKDTPGVTRVVNALELRNRTR